MCDTHCEFYNYKFIQHGTEAKKEVRDVGMSCCIHPDMHLCSFNFRKKIQIRRFHYRCSTKGGIRSLEDAFVAIGRINLVAFIANAFVCAGVICAVVLATIDSRFAFINVIA